MKLIANYLLVTLFLMTLYGMEQEPKFDIKKASEEELIEELLKINRQLKPYWKSDNKHDKRRVRSCPPSFQD